MASYYKYWFVIEYRFDTYKSYKNSGLDHFWKNTKQGEGLSKLSYSKAFLSGIFIEHHWNKYKIIR